MIVEFNEILRDLCKLSYEQNKPNEYKGLKYKKSFNDKKTDLSFDIYEDKNSLIFVYTGTNSFKDGVNDALMVRGKIPSQANIAYEKYKEIFKEEMMTNKKVYFTGHSLGGSIAQLLGRKTGHTTVTFNAYGTGEIAVKNEKTDNIINYGHPQDIIFKLNEKNQVGKVYHTNQHDKKWFSMNGITGHFLENMDDLSNAVLVTKDLDKANTCKGFYTVNGYQNSNGINVKSYVRKCWKH